MNEVVIDDSQREMCAVLVMRTMLTDYCDDTGVSFNDVFFRFVTSPAYKMLFDYSTGLWMEGPDYLRKGRLNLFPLRDQLDDFLAFFIQQGRCDETVLSTRRTVSYIITMSASNSWDTYQDIKDWYFEKKLTTKYLDKIYRIIDHMEYWQLNGTLIGCSFL